MAQPVQRLVLMVNVDSLERTYVLDRNYIHDTVVTYGQCHSKRISLTKTSQ